VLCLNKCIYHLHLDLFTLYNIALTISTISGGWGENQRIMYMIKIDILTLTHLSKNGSRLPGSIQSTAMTQSVQVAQRRMHVSADNPTLWRVYRGERRELTQRVPAANALRAKHVTKFYCKPDGSFNSQLKFTIIQVVADYWAVAPERIWKWGAPIQSKSGGTDPKQKWGHRSYEAQEKIFLSCPSTFWLEKHN